MHYLNGKWVKKDDLKISAFDLSVIRGFGVFDFLRTYDHKPFLLKAHIDRLFNSAKELNMVISFTKKEIIDIIETGIQKNNHSDYNIRIVVTGGVSSDGTTPGNHSLIVMFTKSLDYPKTHYTRGVSVITYPHVRVFPRAKTLNYLVAIGAIQTAKKVGAVEAVYIDENGNILEGTTSNFFCVIDGTLVTPKDTILIGITRGVVLDIARSLNIPIEQRAVALSESGSMDQAFITASNKEVMPVVKIDDIAIGNGKVGEITKKIIVEYRKKTRIY